MKRLPPLDGEQCKLIEEWYGYAITVAFQQARKSHDKAEIISAAHDALISAARHWKQGNGYGKATFAAFYKYCLISRLLRKHRRDLPKQTAQLPADFDIADRHASDQSLDVSEFVAYVREALPPKYQRVITACFDQGIKPSQLAASQGRFGQSVDKQIRVALRLMRRRAERSDIPRYIDGRRTQNS